MQHAAFQLKQGGHARVGPPWSRLESYFYDIHTIYLVRDGAARVQVKDQWFDLKPFQLFFVPGYTWQRRETKSFMQVDWLTFRAKDLDVNAELTALRTVCGITSPQWQHWESVCADWPQPVQPVNNYSIDSRIQSMLHELVGWLIGERIDEARRQDGDEQEKRFREAIAYMEREATNHPDLNDIAAQVHLSPTYFHKRFREQYQVTPRAYMERVRMSRASELLTVHNLAVSEVAQRTGYSSVHYFSRSFRRYFGETPSAIRGRYAEQAM